MEIFEIYCKIQNRLIFIMRIKTFSSFEKKIQVLELRLLIIKRSFEEKKRPGNIATVMGNLTTFNTDSSL